MVNRQLKVMNLGYNAAVVSASVPSVKSVAKDVVSYFVDEPLKSCYLNIIDDLGQANVNEVESIKTFGKHLAVFGSAVESEDQLHHLNDAVVKLSRIYETVAKVDEVLSDEEIVTGSLEAIATCIVQNKVDEWVARSHTRHPIFDLRDITNQVVEGLKDGSYFNNNLYEAGLEMSPEGFFRFVGVAAAPDEEWAEEIG